MQKQSGPITVQLLNSGLSGQPSGIHAGLLRSGGQPEHEQKHLIFTLDCTAPLILSACYRFTRDCPYAARWAKPLLTEYCT